MKAHWDRWYRARLPRAAVAAAVAVPAVLFAPRAAQACGGFFCSQQPIDQAGEQIVFAVDDGHVTATIQIAFQGEAEDFAWVIPVASKPEITVGSQALFTNLRNVTEPQWYLNWDYTNECGWWWGFAEDADGAPSAGGGEGGGGVQVVDTKEVGPYKTVTLASDDAQELVNWLNENDFDQPPESLPLIEHYLAQDMLFVALKLKQDAGVGDIQPVTLDFQESQPCVPLILTRIAALPDMPVRLWILGEHRAVPTNWFHVELNQKKIDWLNYGSNYEELVTQAVNEAAGHGFVTEYAGTTENWKTLLYSEGKFDLELLKNTKNPAEFVQQLLWQGFPRDAQMQNLLRKHIPMPESLMQKGVTEQEFYNCLDCYANDIANLPFDPEAFVADLIEKVIEPLKAAQEMINKYPKATRLFTTVSPEEMDRDPLFDFNPDLPDVSNVHQAAAKAICGEDNQPQTVIITLENGVTFELEGPFDDWYQNPVVGGGGEAAADSIELFGNEGQGRTVPHDTAGYYDQQLDLQTPENVIQEIDRTGGEDPGPGPDGEPGNGGGGIGGPDEGPGGGSGASGGEGGGPAGSGGVSGSAGGSSGSGGCNTTGGTGAAGALGLALLALLSRRRRA